MGLFKRKEKTTNENEKKPAVDATPKPMRKYVPRHVEANAMYGAAVPGDSRPTMLMQRAQTDQAFSTRPGAQPTPGSHSALGAPGHEFYGHMAAQNSDYFDQGRGRKPAFDNTQPFARGRGKTGLGKEPANAHQIYSSDSGYESAGPGSAIQSRAPSMRDLQDPRQYVNRVYSGYSADVRCGEEYPGLEQTVSGDNTRKSHEGILKNFGLASPLDQDYDSRSTQSHKSNGSISKRTRFDDSPEPMPSLEQLEHHRNLSTTLPQHDLPAPLITETSQYNDAGTGASNQIRTTRSKVGDNADAETFSRKTEPLELSAQTFEALQIPHQESEAPTTKHSVDQISLYKVTSATSAVSSRRSTLPPLSILEGFKVNKKGKILDEEGDPIGELVEGDLLDCVRQRVNAVGEVTDDYGRVVGAVRTIAPAKSASFTSTPPNIQSPQQTLILQGPNSPPLRPTRTDLASNTQISYEPVHATAVQHTPLQQKCLADEDQNADETSVNNRHSSEPATVAKTGKEIEEEITQQSPQAKPQDAVVQSHLELAQRPMRSASERSLSELGKPFARPAMSSVPEDNVPEDEILPAENPELFAYKGDIPTVDGPQQDARMRSRSPLDQSFNKMVLAGGHPGSSLFSQGMPGQFSHSGRMPMAPRRATTHFGSAQSSSTNALLSPRQNLNTGVRRSQTGDDEGSPKRSDGGIDSSSTSDDMPTMRRPMHSRTASLHSTSTVSKPRTYFTHGGKITLDVDELKVAKEETPKAAEPAVEKSLTKKRSVFSMGFGRKKSSVIS